MKKPNPSWVFLFNASEQIADTEKNDGITRNGTVKNNVIGKKNPSTNIHIEIRAKKLSGNETITNLFFDSKNANLILLIFFVFIA